MEHIDDSDLIARIRQGDRQAFAVLIRRHMQTVYARISRSVRSDDDVDELVQTVFIAVYHYLGRLRDPERFQAWLNVLVRNTVRTWHRRRAVQMHFEDVLRQEMPPPQDPSADVRLAVQTALGTLSSEHRQVIAYHYLRGYSYAETASLLDLTIETVRGRLKRARHRLKQELQTMSDIHAQSFDLDRIDLDALRCAGAMTSADPNRLILQGICFDLNGRIIVTDGHRLLIRTSPNIATLAAPVILGPWSGIQIPDADRATLTMDETEAILSIPDHQDIAIPLIEGPFVKYEQVIPQDEPSITATIPADLLRDALNLMASHMGARHPVDPATGWQYKPQIEMRLSAIAQTLTLLTTRDLGYNRLEQDGKVISFTPEDAETQPSPGGPIDWSFQIPLSVKAQSRLPEDSLRIGVNFTYLTDIFQALDTPGTKTFTLEFRTPTKAILFRTSAHLDWLALLMPLRLVAPEPSI